MRRLLFAASALAGSGRLRCVAAGAERHCRPRLAVENVLVDAIARGEKSVVAIARVDAERSAEQRGVEIVPGPFGRLPRSRLSPSPGDPDFIPDEFATGVVVDRHGLILTYYHVLGLKSQHYVTTADRKVYPARIKAADPRSDLAVLEIEATNLTPMPLGNGAALKKGQIVIALGNPYAIARDGQASASWGIVANLGRKAGPRRMTKTAPRRISSTISGC